MPLHPRLLEFVRCPACHAELRIAAGEASLDCTGCGLSYPVVNGTPVLLPEQARRPTR